MKAADLSAGHAGRGLWAVGWRGLGARWRGFGQMLAAGADALRWGVRRVTIRGWALRGPTGVAVPGGCQIGVGAGAVPIIAPREERHGRPCDARLLNDVAFTDRHGLHGLAGLGLHAT